MTESNEIQPGASVDESQGTSPPFPLDDLELIAQAKLIDGDSPEQTNTEKAIAEKGNVCKKCGALLGGWEPSCRGCGAQVDSQLVVIDGEAASHSNAAMKELASSYQTWLERGRQHYKSDRLEEAQSCLKEALARLPGLADKRKQEREVRELLAKTWMKLGKTDESAGEFLLLAQWADNEEERERYKEIAKRIGISGTYQSGSFRAIKARDSTRTLFCGSCHRPLLASEVYAYLRSNTSFRCVCGFEGNPVTYDDDEFAKHNKVMVAQERANLVAVASADIPGGRKKLVAVLLAFFLGGVGAHKFYLGDAMTGALYLVTCFTFIPMLVSFFEAIHIAQMSQVNFNLTHNLEAVLERLPEDVNAARRTHSDLLSMKPGEDPVSEDQVPTA
jgi:TM2 domain-containing membrane protein YozV/ribosomal protein L40E